LHYEQWPAPVPLFLLSLVLGWLVYRTGRLTSSIVLHATFNSFSTILMLLMTEAAPELVK
jgi:membrane protease YdiL (CAAX protease family)